MRIIIDYLYANQIAALATTIILIIGITILVLKTYPFEDFDGLPPVKKTAYLMFIGASLLMCILLVIQAVLNPFHIGRAGVVRQAVIMKKTVLFFDQTLQDGAGPGDTDQLMRAWVLDRETGKLIRRTTVRAADPILGANETSLLVAEPDSCYMTDDRFRQTKTIIESGVYRGKKVHRCVFTNGALILSFDDFTESRVPMPLYARRGSGKSDIEILYTGSDRETYRVTRRVNGRMIWQLDQTEGAMREHIPEILYESPPNDLYLLWTEHRLKAISKKTGKNVWTFLY